MVTGSTPGEAMSNGANPTISLMVSMHHSSGIR
jgi:hypothetical protein